MHIGSLCLSVSKLLRLGFIERCKSTDAGGFGRVQKRSQLSTDGDCRFHSNEAPSPTGSDSGASADVQFWRGCLDQPGSGHPTDLTRPGRAFPFEPSEIFHVACSRVERSSAAATQPLDAFNSASFQVRSSSTFCGVQHL